MSSPAVMSAGSDFCSYAKQLAKDLERNAQLHAILEQALQRADLLSLYTEVECGLPLVLAQMRLQGIMLDFQQWAASKEAIAQSLKSLNAEAADLMGLECLCSLALAFPALFLVPA